MWIIWYAVLLHTFWGVLLLLSPAPYGATALHIYRMVPRALMAALLFLASALAAWAVTRRRASMGTLAALLPQQTLLTLSALSALAAVIASHYADGVPRPRLFILADQAPALIVFLLHTAAIIEMHARRPDLPATMSPAMSPAAAGRLKNRQHQPNGGGNPDERPAQPVPELP